ncbi:hypothetical protein ACX2QB_08945 [Weissella viridescens]
MIRYKKEFKQSLVEMHNQGRSYTDLSAEYGPNSSANDLSERPSW